MKKLFAMLFAAVVAISLAMPVFAQDQSGAAGSSDQTATSSTSGKKKMKKAKKEKKPKSDSGAAAPQQ